MWWDFLCKDNSDRICVSLLKFGSVRTTLQFDIPDWFFNWWKKFGINRSAMDPYIIESEYEGHGVGLNKIRDLQESEVMDEKQVFGYFLSNHHQLLVRLKIKVQNLQGQPIIIHQIYTKMWDTLYYDNQYGSMYSD